MITLLKFVHYFVTMGLDLALFTSVKIPSHALFVYPLFDLVLFDCCLATWLKLWTQASIQTANVPGQLGVAKTEKNLDACVMS